MNTTLDRALLGILYVIQDDTSRGCLVFAVLLRVDRAGFSIDPIRPDVNGTGPQFEGDGLWTLRWCVKENPVDLRQLHSFVIQRPSFSELEPP